MKYKLILFFMFASFLAAPVQSQNNIADTLFVAADTLNETSGLFESDELLTISLKFDITRYKKKKSDEEYLDAVMTYYNNNDSVSKNIKVRARGEFRREYCSFPPLLLNFKEKDTIWGGESVVDKIKMVTQCTQGNQETLFREYLVYKLYNVLTDYSFRVRLLKVDYINTTKKNETVSQFAFLIEPVDHLTRRINANEVRTSNLDQKKVIPEMMDRMAIFNYMIGNTDWSVPIQHNSLLLAPAPPMPPDKALIIPYDFDFSGLVDATYSAPFPDLKIKSVRERLYLGVCRSEEVYISALREFSELKSEFYKVINDFPYLNDQSKKEMISYLDEFFDGIGDRNTIVKMILSDCLRF